MEDILVVNVEKCENEDWWYSKLVRLEINVIPYDDINYALYGNPTLLISKSDVRVIGK